jgi:hypothetical protein
MPPHIARGNATRAQVRARVEHVFAAEKHAIGLVIRTIGQLRAYAKITLANLAYSMRRLVWIEHSASSARLRQKTFFGRTLSSASSAEQPRSATPSQVQVTLHQAVIRGVLLSSDPRRGNSVDLRQLRQARTGACRCDVGYSSCVITRSIRSIRPA